MNCDVVMLVSILMSARSLAMSCAQAINPTRRLPDSVLEKLLSGRFCDDPNEAPRHGVESPPSPQAAL